MKITIEITKVELEGLRLLRRHHPLWFREDSDEMGTYEGASKRVVERILRKAGVK